MRKKVLALTAMSLLIVGCYSVKKYKAALTIMERLVVLPKDIKDINLGFDVIRFTFDLELINHTSYDLGFTTGSVLGIAKVKVLTPQGMLLAEIDTDISGIQLLAGGSYTIKDLQVALHTLQLVNEVDKIVAYITQNRLKYELTINAFGKEFTVVT